MELGLKELANCTIQITESNYYPETVEGNATVNITFSNGVLLRADYWRLVTSGRQSFSSFDHKQKYGLPAPINAISRLEEALNGEVVLGAKLDKSTGDIIINCSKDMVLQILNFTGYEVWELSFPNGSREFSNYNT